MELDALSIKSVQNQQMYSNRPKPQNTNQQQQQPKVTVSSMNRLASPTSGPKPVARPEHQRSFSSLYSKHTQHKAYEENHELGYNKGEIKQAVDYIFKNYDANKDNLLDRKEVRKLLESSLLHMSSNHNPSDLQILQFILSIDKNNDGFLSRQELEKAFMRANKIQY